jgi:hypothetical protein
MTNVNRARPSGDACARQSVMDDRRPFTNKISSGIWRVRFGGSPLTF